MFKVGDRVRVNVKRLRTELHSQSFNYLEGATATVTRLEREFDYKQDRVYLEFDASFDNIRNQQVMSLFEEFLLPDEGPW